METDTFGARLKSYRLRAGLTQEELAEQASLSVRALSDLERGVRRMPRQDTLALLAEALHLSAEERVHLLASVPRHRGSARPVREVEGAATPFPWPVPLTRLIGREREESGAAHLLRQEEVRLLTLTGPAGVGKTRLALQLAESLAEVFVDGVRVASLAPIQESGLVLSALAELLDVREVGSQPLLDRLKLVLHHQQCLLVLDNFEQVLAAAPLLVELLGACPQVKALVTSRARLQVRGEYELVVPPLALPDPGHLPTLSDLNQYGAVALFVARARTVQSTFALTEALAPLVAELCVRLDGLPLAIELAAARLKLLPLPTLLAQLEDRLTLLTGGARDLPERQQTMRQAIGWSYALLSEVSQQLFRRLSVFAGSWTLTAASQVCSVGDEPASPLLEEVATLVDQSLVQPVAVPGDEEPRFQLLETLRAYGLEQLEQAGEVEALRGRHARYLLALAEREQERLLGPEQASALARLSQEMDNLRATLRWLQDHDDLEHGLQLAGALWQFWLRRGALSEGRAWLETLLARGKHSGKVLALTEAHACYGAGALAAEQGDYARALALAQHCVFLAEQGGNERLQARALNLQGNVSKFQGQFALAARLYEAGLSLFRTLHEQASVAILLNNLATLAQEHGDYARARALQEESLAIKRSQGDQRGIAVALTNLGDTARKEGHLDEAHARAEESLALFDQLADEKSIAIVLNNLGQAAFLQGAYEQAAAYIQQSLTRAERIGAEWVRAVALHTKGQLAAARGERAEAESAYYQSWQLYARERSHLGMVECLEGLIALYAATDPERGARLYGLTTTWRARMETPLPPVDVPALEQAVAAMRATLGKEAFTAVMTAGQALSLEQVLSQPL